MQLINSFFKWWFRVEKRIPVSTAILKPEAVYISD